MNMKKARAVASYTFVESVRTRMFGVIGLFGAVLVAAALMLTALGGEQKTRILLDFGLASIEILGLVAAAFAAVTLVGGEMETKTIYLILTRPISRASYLAGRYAGFMAAAWSAMAVMAVAHGGLLALLGPVPAAGYVVAVCFSMLKVAIAGAVALLFSLVLSSAVTALGFTALFWMLGHFGSELLFLGDKIGSIPARAVTAAIAAIVPNLSLLSVRDLWDIPGLPSAGMMASGIAYAALYVAVCISCAAAVFRRREF